MTNRSLQHLKISWQTLIVFLVLKIIHGQEAPFFNIKAYDNSTNYRQNFCDRNAAIENRSVTLKHALSDMNIHAAVFDYQLKNEKVIDFAFKVFDEIAKRGKFKWRNTYGILYSESYTGNNTYDTVLYWATDTYDMILEWYNQLPDRLALGISYPDSWYDGSIIMIQKKFKASNDFKFFAFADPFTWEVWVLLFGTIIASGFMYHLIDVIDCVRLHREKDRGIQGKLFNTAFALVGHIDHNPKSFAATLTVLSTAVLYTVVIAAYTANLASFLVVKNAPDIKINMLQDAVDNNMKLCVWKDTSLDKIVSAKHPSYPHFVRKLIQRDIFESVQDGTCDIALVSVDSWRKFERDDQINGDCSLEWVGRNIHTNVASYPFKGSIELCSYLLRHVIDLHLNEMKLDGKFDEIWDDHLNEIGSGKCDINADATKSKGNTRLNINNIGGVMFFHGCICFAAFLISILTAFLDPKSDKKAVSRLSSIIWQPSLNKDERTRFSDNMDDDECVEIQTISKGNDECVETQTISEGNYTSDDLQQLVKDELKEFEKKVTIEKNLLEKRLMIAVEKKF